jgi:hypothetical protein
MFVVVEMMDAMGGRLDGWMTCIELEMQQQQQVESMNASIQRANELISRLPRKQTTPISHSSSHARLDGWMDG